LNAFQEAYPETAPLVEAYLEQLGSFFYKYIKRNLEQIRAEQDRQVGSMATVEGLKQRLTHMQQQVFAPRTQCEAKAASLVTDREIAAVTSALEAMQSPVRARLDSSTASPVAKRLCGGSPSTRKAVSMAVPPQSDTTILSLKERLARLRHSTAVPLAEENEHRP